MTENETTGRGVTRKPGRKPEEHVDRSTVATALRQLREAERVVDRRFCSRCSLRLDAALLAVETAVGTGA